MRVEEYILSIQQLLHFDAVRSVQEGAQSHLINNLLPLNVAPLIWEPAGPIMYTLLGNKMGKYMVFVLLLWTQVY